MNHILSCVKDSVTAELFVGVNITYSRGKCEAVVNERLTVVEASESECKPLIW